VTPGTTPQPPAAAKGVGPPALSLDPWGFKVYKRPLLKPRGNLY
jgi:hypothetical protein